MKVKVFYLAVAAALVLSFGIAAQPQGAAIAQPLQYWAQTYGGDGGDYANSVQQTSDGGYIVAGGTNSFGVGDDDFGVLKLNSIGDIQWQKTYGGDADDCAYSVQQTSDGGYIAAGRTDSFGTGNYDFWVLKLDPSGDIQWQKAYGGGADDCAYSIRQTSGGGYIVAGETYSLDTGNYDSWVLKLDPSGTVQWQKTYGGGADDCAYSVQQTFDGGYIIAGETYSFGAGDNDFWVLKLYSNGDIAWQKTYGGDADDCAYSIQQTSDRGYIVAGETESFEARGGDFWALKLDLTGDVQWQNTYGGSKADCANSVQQTSDGGYIVAGYTESFEAKGGDFWALKLDSTGDVQWQNTYGGTSLDSASFAQQTSDGGYIAAGRTSSFGAGSSNFWVLKLDPGGLLDSECSLTRSSDAAITGTEVTGVDADIEIGGNATNIIYCVTTVTPSSPTVSIELQCSAISRHYWVKNYDGFSRDEASYIEQASDGGYIVAGSTSSFGAGSDDFWVLKLDSIGDIRWQKTYGGGSNDYPTSIQQTSDGGYIVAGRTASFGARNGDFWVLKLDSEGNVTWQKTYGGGADDCAYSIQETSDEGYIVAGIGSFGTKGDDFWVLKLDSTGDIQWQKTYGGSSQERACSIRETSDGGYIVAGTTKSFGTGIRDNDFWVLKLGSTGNIQWQKTYGGEGDDRAYSARETSDGGYIVAGRTKSFGTGVKDYDFWVLKLGSTGNVEWQKAYGGNSQESAYSIQQTFDAGYIVAGVTSSFGAWNTDFWILKLAPSGDVQWQKTYGGTNTEYANSIQQVSDGGYIVAGTATPSEAGSSGFWVLRLLPSGLLGNECSVIGDSDADITDTRATVSDTVIFSVDTSVTLTDTDAVISNTNADIQEQCPATSTYLHISPRQVSPKQPVSISIHIANPDDETISRTVQLRINDNLEDSQTVDIPPLSTGSATFTVVKVIPGDYTVSLEGQYGQFTVIGSPAPVGGLSTGGIIAIVVVAIVLIVAMILIAATARRSKWD